MTSLFPKPVSRSLIIYALFTVPTLLLLLYAGGTDATLSRHIGGSWQAEFWQLPGASALLSRVILDILVAIGTGVLGCFFYRGFQTLNTLSIPDAASQSRLLRQILKATLIAGALLLPVIPFHSSDLYGYLNRGFQQSIYHTNPYLTPVAEIPGWQKDTLFHSHWVYNPCPYGFFFAQLASWITSLADTQFFNAFLLFKGLNLLLILGSTLLIYKIGQQARLQRPWLSAYLFGANPLVLLHVMGNGHNDILMVFLLLVSLNALFSSRWGWASLPLLTLSVLTKYASLLALPFMLLYMLKKRQFRSLLVGTAISAILCVILAIPYVDPNRHWPLNALLDNAGKPQHSLIDLIAQSIYYPTKWLQGHADGITQQALSILKPLFWASFVLFYGWQCLQAVKRPATTQDLLFRIGLTMTIMVAFVSAKFHPWYPVMFLPLLLTLPEASRLRQFGLTFSLFQLAGFTIFQNLPVISPLFLTVLPLWLTFKGTLPFKPASPPSPGE